MTKSSTSLVARQVMDYTRSRLAAFMGWSHGGARDLYSSFGYPRVVPTEALEAMYLRNDIANRIISAAPGATWRAAPVIRDDQGDSAEEGSDSYSPFVHAVEDLFDKHRIFHFIQRADRLSGIGRFGVLLMGFRDGKKLDEPLEKGNAPLLYLQPYGELQTNITQFDVDEKSPRFGRPIYYNVQQGAASGEKTVQTKSLRVHWTRIIHLAEFVDSNDVYGTPRLLPVYNRMMDLEKVMGGGAETYWLNARQGLAITTDKESQLTEDILKDMKTQIDDFEHHLRRTLAMQGVTATQLNATFVDPGPFVDRLLDLIAGTVGIPKRILVGSERGELGGDNDENNWNSRIDERRTNFATPAIIQPLVTRLIETGNLPQPRGVWWTEWPEAAALGPEAIARIGQTRAATLSAYLAAPGADMVVPPQEFRTDFLGLPPESEYDDPILDEEPLPEEEAVEEEPAVDDEGDDDTSATQPKTAKKKRRNYSPDQPRDDDGKFGEGPGSGSSPAATAKDVGVDIEGMSERAAVKAIHAEHQTMFANSYKGKLDDGMKTAVDNYASNDYLVINDELRMGQMPPGKYAETVGQMDRMFKDVSLSQDVVTHRTVSGDLYAQFEANVGGEFYDSAYTSTSATKGGGLVDKPGARAMRVVIPKGSKAAPIAHIGDAFEQEILIDRGARFSIGKDKDGLVITLLGTGE
ncbi:MAG: phage portal protein [Phycisphaerales bacterium]